MSKVGLDVIAINSSTRDEASRHLQEELWVTAQSQGNIIVAGPEQLKTKEFEKTVIDDVFWARTCGLGFDEVHLLNVWGPRFRKDFLQMGFVKARLNDTHCPWILTSATIRDGAPFDNILHLLGLRGTPLHIIRRSNYRPEIQLLFREFTSPIDGDSFPELEWVLESGRSTLIFAKTISLGTRIHSHLFSKAPHGNRDRNIRLYNSLNWDDYNAETRALLAGVPGSSEFCQIGIGTDTLSVGIDMPAIADAILVGDIDDADEGFQKLGRTGRRKDIVGDPRGIVYTTASACEAAEQALAAAEAGAEAEAAATSAGHKSQPYIPAVDLSWPTMLCTKCKEEAQHTLYNKKVVNIACRCEICLTDPPPPLVKDVCNCSGCIPETLTPILKPRPAPTILSTIPTADRISSQARSHGEQILANFRKEVWRADTSNCLFPPEVYLPDRLIKEILDRFSQLISIEAVKIFLQPYERLKHQEHGLFNILQALKIDFDVLTTVKKAETAAKRKATAATKAAGKRAEMGADAQARGTAELTREDSDVDDVAEPLEGPSEGAGPLNASKHVQAKSTRSRRAPVLSTKEVAASNGRYVVEIFKSIPSHVVVHYLVTFSLQCEEPLTIRLH
jgi:hypothetical protein